MLEGASNHHKWKRQMQDFLEMLDLWHWIEVENTPPVIRPATAAVTATNNRAGHAVVAAVTETDVAVWIRAHKKICTMIKTRCDDNPRDKIEECTNVANAWEILEEYKPRGLGILNSTIQKLESLTLAACDNKAQTYANRFVSALREVNNLPGRFPFTTDENWKIHHFYKGLGSQYNSYREQYSQNHDPCADDGSPKFTLSYAITRFINTVTESTGPTEDVHALAAIMGGSLGHTQHSVLAFVASGGAAEHRI